MDKNFFITTAVHQWLTEHFEGEASFDEKKGVNIQYDIIEQPFRCTIQTSDEDAQVKVYIRNEMGVFVESPDLGITLFDNGDEPEIINSGRIGGDVVQTAMLFLQGGFILNEIFENSAQAEIMDELDPETEGILVELKDDSLNFKKVYGKQRPDLACTTLFGGVQMARPYEDEVMESWLMDIIPFDKQLEAAEQGDEDAMLNVATTYLNGDYAEDVGEDAEKAVYWFQKLADLGNSLGQFNLAIQYVKGEGVEHSFEKALYWMKKAEENGDEDAAKHIEQYQTILESLDKANGGDTSAMAMVSEQYMSIGASIGYDYEELFFAKSFEWANKAAEKKDLNGLYLLGLCYEHGRGVESDDVKSAEMYQKAAEQGHEKSQWNLAAKYVQGIGIERDVEKAQYWAEKSAAQGYNLAIRGLFAMIIDFCEDDLQEKFERLERLAEQCPNDAEVYHKLALAYMDEDENGDMYDMDRAIYWFKLAGENGHYMSEKQYHLWSYIKKLKAEGLVVEDGDYLGYIINNGLLGEAESYES